MAISMHLNNFMDLIIFDFKMLYFRIQFDLDSLHCQNSLVLRFKSTKFKDPAAIQLRTFKIDGLFHRFLVFFYISFFSIVGIAYVLYRKMEWNKFYVIYLLINIDGFAFNTLFV